MKVGVHIQHPKSRTSETLREQISARLRGGHLRLAKVAAAYVTVAGLRQLLDAFPGSQLQESWWLVGLDDALTQPDVLEILQSRPAAHLRVGSYEEVGLRFHPKVFGFARTSADGIRLAFVGSANLTVSALTGNGEAVSILECQTSFDRANLDRMWSALWKQGRALRDGEVEAYRKRYDAASAARSKLIQEVMRARRAEKQAEVLASDVAQLDPSLAKTCWIEGGYITAMGRELEFKAEQGLFFGLSPSGLDSPQTFDFHLSSGEEVPLRMKYQGNHMWRLQLNSQVPEVQQGLRPRQEDGSLGRSPYVAVFRKTNHRRTFDLEFIKLGSKEFDDLLSQSTKTGTVGHTTARQYGWC